MAQSPEAQTTKMVAQLSTTTGKSMSEWLALTATGGKSGRLEAAGSWNAMVTHRVKLASVTDVDSDVIGWLQRAYAMA